MISTPPTDEKSDAPGPKLGKNSAAVGLAIGCSRILGLVREVIFAALFGAGLAKDAFDVAFRIPNILRDLFAEGAMSTAFVTTFSSTKTEEGPARAFEIANRVLSLLISIVGGVVILGCLTSSSIVDLYASGFSEVEGKSGMTTTLMQIMFPFLLLVSVSSVFMGICNSFGSFGRPAMAPALFNVGTIVGGTALAFWFRSIDIPMIYGMGFGTVLGGLLQWALLVPQARRFGFKFRFDLTLADSGVRRVLTLMGPALIGLSAVQINILVTTGFASQLENGSISWLSYAFRLMQLPIGVFGVAIATAALPNLAELAAKNRPSELASALTEAVNLCLVLTVPAAVGLWVLSEDIIRSIYRWMAFTEYDVSQTAQALKFYALGLVGYGMVKIFAPAYYATTRTKIPVVGTVVAIGTNVLLCLLLIDKWRHIGLAGATSVAACANLAILVFANFFTEWRIDLRSVLALALKVTMSSLIMGYVINEISMAKEVHFGHGNQSINIVALALAILAGLLTYGISCGVMNVNQVTRISGRIRRQ